MENQWARGLAVRWRTTDCKRLLATVWMGIVWMVIVLVTLPAGAMPPSDFGAVTGREHSTPALGPSILSADGATAPAHRSPSAVGTNQVLVLRADFPDVVWDDVRQSHAAYQATMDVASDYYEEISRGLHLVDFSVSSTIYRVSRRVAFYGGNNEDGWDQAYEEFFSEVLLLADADIDFSGFDDVIVAFAGPGEEDYGVPSTRLWSRRFNFSPVELDGVRISGGMLVSERYNSDSSVACSVIHEYGHALGLPDLYSFTSGYIVGSWAMMSGGAWCDIGETPAPLSAWSRVMLGWETPVVVEEHDAVYPINRFGSGSEIIYRVPIHGGPDGPEYYLIENRQAWADSSDEDMPGSGLLIWHVDMTVAAERHRDGSTLTRWEGNSVNSSERLMLALEEADGLFELRDDIDYGDAGDPFFDPSEFTNASTPSTRDNDDSETTIAFVEISELPDTEPGTMSFRYQSGLRLLASSLISSTEVELVFNRPIQSGLNTGDFSLEHVTGGAAVSPVEAVRQPDDADHRTALLTFASPIDDEEVWVLQIDGIEDGDGGALAEQPTILVNPFGINVPPFLPSNTIYGEGGNPHYLADDVFVMYGATLEAGAGTLFRFGQSEEADDWPSHRVDLVVHGRLRVQGTHDSPVRFDSVQPAGARAPGDWGSVMFDTHGGGTSRLEHAVIEHGGADIAAVYVGRDNIEVADCRFASSGTGWDPALRIAGNTQAVVERCRFESCTRSLTVNDGSELELNESYFEGGSFGIRLGGSADIESTEFRSLTTAIYSSHGSRLEIRDSAFDDNGKGVFVTEDSSVIVEETGFSGSSEVALAIGDTEDDDLDDQSSATVFNCEFIGNQNGITVTEEGELVLSRSHFDGNWAGLDIRNSATVYATGNLFENHDDSGARAIQIWEDTGATVGMFGNGFEGNEYAWASFSSWSRGSAHNYYDKNTVDSGVGEGSVPIALSLPLQYPVDWSFVPTELSFRDTDYDAPVDTIRVLDPAYVEVTGAPDDGVRSGEIAWFYSDSEPSGLFIHLYETSTASGSYRTAWEPETLATLGETTDFEDYRLTATPGDQLTACMIFDGPCASAIAWPSEGPLDAYIEPTPDSGSSDMGATEDDRDAGVSDMGMDSDWDVEATDMEDVDLTLDPTDIGVEVDMDDAIATDVVETDGEVLDVGEEATEVDQEPLDRADSDSGTDGMANERMTDTSSPDTVEVTQSDSNNDALDELDVVEPATHRGGSSSSCGCSSAPAAHQRALGLGLFIIGIAWSSRRRRR